MAAFLERHPEWVLSVSTTTRAPRPGEVHGEHYFFTDRAEFERRFTVERMASRYVEVYRALIEQRAGSLA